jgi:NAD(P)-dependent dehydrogenase (short-subunit alcohol dehydrogenase family)
MTSGLDGRVALVTGGGGAIGTAIVVALAHAGVAVAVADIDGDAADRTVEHVHQRGGRAAAQVVDLSELTALDGLVSEVEGQFGPIDILVNNAAVVGHSAILDGEESDWRHVLEVNLMAPWRLIQLVAGSMIDRGGGGNIVNVSSSSAFRALSANGPYGVSKAGLVALTRGAAGELGRHDINVNAVAPGVTRTPMTAARIGDAEALEAATTAGPLANLLGRPSEPEDVAAAVLFLCSPASRQITAQVIHTSAGAIVGSA